MDLQNELKQIQSQLIRDFTDFVLKELPEYFWNIPASSTGKYHPDFAAGPGGLIRHTKAAVYLATTLFPLHPEFFQSDKDMIISALILHDGLKHGDPKQDYTVHEHPLLMARFIRAKGLLHRISTTTMDLQIAKMVESHSGQWTTNSFSSIVLPKPETWQAEFVHLCDYLASRKNIDFKNLF